MTNYVQTIHNINFPKPTLSDRIILIPRVHRRGHSHRSRLPPVQPAMKTAFPPVDSKDTFPSDQPLISYPGRTVSVTTETHWKNDSIVHNKPSTERSSQRVVLPGNVLQKTPQPVNGSSMSENRIDGQSTRPSTSHGLLISRIVKPVFRAIAVRKEFRNG